MRDHVRRFVQIARSDGLSEAIRQTRYYLRRKRVARLWEADGGHHGTRFDFDVTEDDVILDVGGFDGNFAADFLDRHDPGAIHVFEPLGRVQDAIEERFADDDRVVLHEYGLGGWTRDEEMAVAGSSSSLYRSSTGDTERVEIRDVAAVLDELGHEHVELLKLNAEGAEYEILNRLFETGDVDRFGNIQVSFHHVVDEPERRRNAIRGQLEATHELSYDYEFVMEEWTRKASVTPRTETTATQSARSPT